MVLMQGFYAIAGNNLDVIRRYLDGLGIMRGPFKQVQADTQHDHFQQGERQHQPNTQ